MDSFFGTSSAAFSPDASLVAVTGTGRDDTVRRWNPLTGEDLGRLVGHRGRANAVAMNAAGTQIATAGADHTMRLWSTATAVCQRVLIGHTDQVQRVAFNPVGTQLASWGGDGLRLWDLDSGGQVGQLDDPDDRRDVDALAFSPDGGRLAVAGRPRTVRVWDLVLSR